MTIVEIIQLSGICFCFYMIGRLHESISSFKSQVKSYLED